MIQEIFTRTETKYLLTSSDFEKLMQLSEPKLEKDRYFKGTNCSIYFDTDHDYLAVHSLEKPLYKEKIRLRSYNVPAMDDTVFLELKKKYSGVGNKRRIHMSLRDFYRYQKSGKLETDNPQIKEELDYCFKFYDLKPRLFLAYDRLAYNDKADRTFRVTFDQNIRSRTNDLRLEHGDYGDLYFKNGEIVMEVKASGAYPIWFTHNLNRLHIYPASFSKYGRIMQDRAAALNK